MKVGDFIEHLLMEWRGVIVCDLRDNPWCSEHWKVKFNIDGELAEKHVFESEIKPSASAPEQPSRDT